MNGESAFEGSIVGLWLAVAEGLRLLAGGKPDELVDLDLRAVNSMEVVPQALDFSTLNPGFTVHGY